MRFAVARDWRTFAWGEPNRQPSRVDGPPSREENNIVVPFSNSCYYHPQTRWYWYIFDIFRGMSVTTDPQWSSRPRKDMSPVSRCVKQFQSKCNFSIDHILNVAGERNKPEDEADGEKKFEWLNCTRYKPPKLQSKSTGLRCLQDDVHTLVLRQDSGSGTAFSAGSREGIRGFRFPARRSPSWKPGSSARPTSAAATSHS